MIHPPINSITWTLGAIALYTFGFKSWRAYKQTKNQLAQMYYILGLSFGTALFLFGVPGLLTQNLHILRLAYFSADFFVQVSMQVQVWLLWFIGLRNRIRLRWLLAVTLPLSTLTIVIEVLTSRAAISRSPYLIIYSDRLSVSILKSIIYLAIAMPLGYFFLLHARDQITRQAKIKSFTAGMIFIVVCLGATINNIFDKGSDTVGSSIVVAIFFIIFLLGQLPSPKPPNGS